MLMRHGAGNPVHPSLLLTSGPQTLVVTAEGTPLSVSTNLLVLYSPGLLGTLLVSLIIHDVMPLLFYSGSSSLCDYLHHPT